MVLKGFDFVRKVNQSTAVFMWHSEVFSASEVLSPPYY
jgi:hypothetical protein